MFGFRWSRHDPLADARSAQRWLAANATADALACQEILRRQLAAVSANHVSLTPRRLAALFVVDAHADELFRSLAAQYVEHANRSAKIEHQLWSALFDLSQAFQSAYQAYARTAVNHESQARWRELLPELTCRQIVHLGYDLRARQFHYESWIPGKWAELHGLLSFATSRQIERVPVTLAHDRLATTIEHQYLKVVVMQLADTGNLSLRQLATLWQELDGWCAALHLSMTARTPTAFYVDLMSRDGLKRRTPNALEGSVLFVDMQPLHAVLMQHRSVLEEAMKGRPRWQNGARAGGEIQAIERIAARIDPEFRPIPRQGERAAASGRVEAIVGLARIAGYLREEDRDPDFQLYAGKSFGGSLELAVFGQLRDASERRAALARHRLAQYASHDGPWELRDMSKTGFRLFASTEAANAFPIGTLIAIRPRDETAWTLGIVRRMRRLTAERTEVGLEKVASSLAGVDLVEQRRGATGEAEYLVDGEDGIISGRSFLALHLTLKKSARDAGVQSLIVPPGDYRTGACYAMVSANAICRVVLGRPLEQQPDWVWSAIESQEIGVRTGAGAAPRASPAGPY